MDCGAATPGGLGETDGPICNARGGPTAALTIKVWLSQGNGVPAALKQTSAREGAILKLMHGPCFCRLQGLFSSLTDYL